jgi:hypothetical protein
VLSRIYSRSEVPGLEISEILVLTLPGLLLQATSIIMRISRNFEYFILEDFMPGRYIPINVMESIILTASESESAWFFF